MNKNVFPICLAFALATTSVAISDEPPVCATETCQQDLVQTRQQQTRAKLAELANNNAIVMQRFDAFAEVLNKAYKQEKSLTAAEMQEIYTGVDFAAEKHRLQTRKNADKTPYISHPIGVAYNVVSRGDVRDASVIIGALLHDTVEDTQTTFDEIEGKFGKTVAGLVRELTDDKSKTKEERKRLQVANASHKSKGAAQIKLADKLFNLNDLLTAPPADWSQERIDQYVEWAQSVVDRLPQANDKLLGAVDDAINTYWDKQSS